MGYVDSTTGVARIKAARSLLDETIREGLFVVEDHRWFDWRAHYESVDDWLERREKYPSTSVIPPALLARVRRAMKVPGTTLVVGERTRATLLGRR